LPIFFFLCSNLVIVHSKRFFIIKQLLELFQTFSSPLLLLNYFSILFLIKLWNFEPSLLLEV
jgi:hypothetical protein